MSARAMASSTISFGLVSLPVKLYATGQSGTKVSFNLVHQKCGSRLKQQYVCPKCDVVVEKDEIIKGYEFSKDQYVLFTPEELDAIETPKSEGIEITEFVPAEEVDPVYLERSYYLGPDKGGARAYRLLAAALRETGRVAIARYAARGKMYLVLVRPMNGEGGMVMEQLRYADEVRDFSEVPVEDGDVAKPELKLAMQLVEQSSSESFEPAKYHDLVREQMMEMIQRKVEGEEITAAPTAEVAQPQIIDLMAALKASLSEKEGRKPAARATKKKSAAEKSEKKPARRKSARG
ncbi:MAG TPA: Ku protein [Gemmatimonadota bacterium]|nr:Ku protein [Gemmatimonadota bacterium]